MSAGMMSYLLQISEAFACPRSLNACTIPAEAATATITAMAVKRERIRC